LCHQIGWQFRCGGALGDGFGVLRDQLAGQLGFEMVAGVLPDHRAIGDELVDAVIGEGCFDEVDELPRGHRVQFDPAAVLVFIPGCQKADLRCGRTVPLQRLAPGFTALDLDGFGFEPHCLGVAEAQPDVMDHVRQVALEGVAPRIGAERAED